MTSPGQNVLIPAPGFPSYETLLGNIDCDIRAYNCLPEKEWECDIAQMESLIDDNTAFMLIVSDCSVLKRLLLADRIIFFRLDQP